APTRNDRLEGKDLFNSAYVMEDGRVVSKVNKALLPNYDVFDEYRYFEPGLVFKCIEVKGLRIALTICEDLWNMKDNPLYLMSPMDELIKEKPSLMLNIAASPFSYVHDDNRVKVLSENCKKYELPLLYVNQVGAQTEIVFDGGSFAFDKKGNLLHHMKYFEEDFRIFEFNDGEIQGLE